MLERLKDSETEQNCMFVIKKTVILFTRIIRHMSLRGTSFVYDPSKLTEIKKKLLCWTVTGYSLLQCYL
jgi:hypothetical protein